MPSTLTSAVPSGAAATTARAAVSLVACAGSAARTRPRSRPVRAGSSAVTIRSTVALLRE
ncbi:hypothetical protein [Brachybacterium sp. GPGPB12]|uniref:hypothetical protein n=1 Tax=Brachybacterium sp. GPGPB12 TaxID=3023517 RepID=UPI00313438D2